MLFGFFVFFFFFYAGTDSIEDGSREVVRVALLGPDGPTGTFPRWENGTIPWCASWLRKRGCRTKFCKPLGLTSDKLVG